MKKKQADVTNWLGLRQRLILNLLGSPVITRPDGDLVPKVIGEDFKR